MRPSRQPYALDVPAFPFPALVSLAARLPLGGGREVALATFTLARIAADVRDGGLTDAERQERAAGARKWLATLTVGDPQRRALSELINASEAGAGQTAQAVRRVMEITAPILDTASRNELDRLARDLESQTVGRS